MQGDKSIKVIFTYIVNSRPGQAIEYSITKQSIQHMHSKNTLDKLFEKNWKISTVTFLSTSGWVNGIFVLYFFLLLFQK